MISKDRLLLQQQIYNFLRSVTIKFDPIAQYINTALVEKGYAVNEQNPYTWKYYLNMQGKYHISDTLMYVTSLDTQHDILFSPDILVDHPRTRSVYVPGGLYYNRLCETYPEQVDLIKSIVFPVTDIEKAITADDLTLLGYSSGYLEEYEENMMTMEIENFLEILKERWYFTFLDDEPYFYLTFWGSLWTYLAMLLMSARESYVHTPYVHSWHLWNDLKAQGLDDYSDILDRKKSMMLYQNIDYLKANAGKQSNLIILANRLLSDFGISIYGRKVVQEAETNADKYQLIPQLQAVVVPTDTATITSEISTVPVATIQSQVYAKGLTPENTSEAAAVKERRMGDTTLNNFMTKFLEIRPITRNKIYSGELNMFLLETLTTSIIRGYYNKPVRITDPSTGVQLYLYPKELLAIYHYATQKSLGLTPVYLPNQVSLYKAFTTEIDTPSKTIKRGEEIIYITSHVKPDEYFKDVVYKEDLQDPEDFADNLTTLWMRYMDHHLMDRKTKIDRKHYILNYLSSLCHKRRTEELDLVPGYTEYDHWFGPEGIDIASSILSQYDIQLSPTDAWGSLADSIISALVPMTDILNDFGNFTLSDFGYTRLRQLFVQMVSYRVVFLESSRDTPQSGVGAKWSTYYGPDDIETFGDRVLTKYIKTISSLHHKRSIILHLGWCSLKDTKVVSRDSYTVTNETHLSDLDMVSYGEMFTPTILSVGTTMTQGTLALVHNGSVPTGVIEYNESDDYLVDDDAIQLIDDDGIYIVDPPAPETDLIDDDGSYIVDSDDKGIVDPED